MKEQLQQVPWKDLTTMNARLVWNEMALPLPWFILSAVLFATAAWPLGFLASAMFFLCTLRFQHEAIHGNLGLPRWADNLIMHVTSPVLMGSNHAIAYAHVIHHRNEGAPEDVEGRCGHMSLGQVLAYGPRFHIDTVVNALRHAPKARQRRVLIDLGLIALFAGAAFMWGPSWLKLHVVAMIIGQCIAAFAVVWLTHHGAHDHGIQARSQRGVAAKAAYFMLYHREHHLFPAVPVHRLPELADRLDKIPSYAKSHLPVVPFLDRSCA